MKHAAYFFCLSFFFFAFSCQTDSATNGPYTIGGNAGVESAGKQVVLQKFDPITQQTSPISNTEVTADGSYSFEYEFDQPDLFRLDFPTKERVQLAIDRGENSVEVNVDEAVSISGCTGCQLIQEYDIFRKKSFNQWVKPANDTMRKARQGDGSIDKAAAVALYAKNSDVHRKELIDFAKDKMANSPALYASALRWTGDDNLEVLQELIAGFEKNYPDIEMTKKMKEKVERFQRISVGEKSPEFSMRTANGENVSLKAGLGKLTLIDFWASWCGPCLLQLPGLVDIYDEYEEKDFEIVGFSLDTNEEGWKKAIDRFGLTWENGSDLQGYKSPVAVDYNITLIPFNLLLDENGVIIAKNATRLWRVGGGIS